MSADPIAMCAPCRIMRWANYLSLRGDPVETNWPALFEELATAPIFRGDEHHPGWSPTVCSQPTRKDASVTHLSALVLDVDGEMSVDEARELFSPLYGLIHTTRKHAPDHPRIRVVLVLSRLITPEEHLTLWVWAQDLTGRRLDAKTRNPSRFWYLPGIFEGGAFEAHVLPGIPLDVEMVLSMPRAVPESPVPSPPTSTRTHSLTERIRRASAYLRAVPPAISGQAGHGQTWAAALAVVRGFDLPPNIAMDLLQSEYNPRCVPPWSVREIEHKVRTADQDGRTPRGWKLEDPAHERHQQLSSNGSSVHLNNDVEREAIRGEPAQHRGPRFLFVDDIFSELPPRNYLVPGLNLGPGAPNGLFAYSWGGKSIIIQDMALSIATGTNVFGQFSCRQGNVVHVDYEQGAAETIDRYQRLARARGIDRDAVGGRLRVAALPPIYLPTTGAEDAYRAACEGAALLYVDSLGAAQPGKVENEASFREGLDLLARVSEATGVTVVFVGHTGKADLAAEKVADGRVVPRGSSAIVAACGSAFALSGGKGDPKLVTMIKGRSLGGVQCEDFYLRLEPVKIDGYKNVENPADPGGFRVVYETMQQVHPPKTPQSEVDADVVRVIEAIRAQGIGGVSGSEAVAGLAGMKAIRCRVAVKVALMRGLLLNVAKKKDGEPDQQHPRFVVSGAQQDSSRGGS